MPREAMSQAIGPRPAILAYLAGTFALKHLWADINGARVISRVRRESRCVRYWDVVRQRNRTGRHSMTGSLEKGEVLACIIIRSCIRAAKGGAVSWRAIGTIRELICAVKQKFQHFSITTTVYVINVLST
jgi:hypothetical protein